MKQSNIKKCITSLSLCVCLLTGSELATAKAGNWHEIFNKQQEPSLLALNAPVKEMEMAKAAQINPVIKKSANQVVEKKAVKPVEQKKTVKPAIQKKAVQDVQVQAKQKSAIQAIKKNAAEQVQVKRSTPSKIVKRVPEANKKAAKELFLEIPSGNKIKYSRLIPVKATAYTADAEENGMWGAFDYYGNPLKLGTIAVDPDVIPMGSTVYITGYSFDGLPIEGMIAKATDQGSSIQGKRVDIYVPASKTDATKFGMQDVKVYIME
jgi:3D (Asp-Asp-Asp) domain-containing protein